MAISLKGLLFVLSLLLSAVFGIHVILIPAILFYLISVKLCQRYLNVVMEWSWFTYVAGVIELVFGINVIISGDIKRSINKYRPTIIILNHRTRFDWLFLVCFMARLGSLSRERIILKTSLKHVPIFGAGMQLIQYIFLQRKWSDDREYVVESLNYYCDMEYPVQLLIFPEGTDLSKKNQLKDKEYSEKNGLSVNKYVLNPRTTGFVQCLQTLRNGWKERKVDICDVTVGYIGEVPQGERELLKGHLPKEVHFHVTHYPSSTLPSSDEELNEWLKKRWREKEELLTEFYKTSSFPGPVLKDSWITKVIMVAILLKWFILCAAVIYGLFQAPILMSIILGIPLVIHFVVDKWMDGWEKLALKKWKKSKNKYES